MRDSPNSVHSCVLITIAAATAAIFADLFIVIAAVPEIRAIIVALAGLARVQT